MEKKEKNIKKKSLSSKEKVSKQNLMCEEKLT